MNSSDICRVSAISFMLAISLASVQTQAAAPVTTLPCDKYIALRGGLPNCRVRFEQDRHGRVAFLGGSITWGEGWRTSVCEMLRKRFPHTQFDFINAGIPSTDTAFAPFRLERDVFCKGPVDLLFVEFAVNDETNGRTATESIRGMEGIVRKARTINPAIDLVIMYFVDPQKMEVIRKGATPAVIVHHDRVARHYDVPAIDLAREVTERIDAGEFTWGDFRDLHPSPFGHALYARSIARLFDMSWSTTLPTKQRTAPYPLPAPLDPMNYGRASLVDIDRAQLIAGWRRDPAWQPTEGGTRDGFVRVPMLVTDRPGAELRLKFQGTAVGILVAAGFDVGILDYRIDDQPARRQDLFTQWSGQLHIPWAYILDADLKDGPHELVLKMTDQKNPQSRGHAARIVKFLVNGKAP